MTSYAPEAFAALLRAESVLAGRTDPLTLVARAAVAEALGGDPAPGEHGVAHAFAQQMTLDVAGITDAQRAEALGVLGREAFGFVQAVYLADMGTRVRLALAQLLDLRLPGAEPAEGDLWPAVEELMRAVARERALDPVTTELVRLRGARAHDCRLCRSLRDVRALDAGAGEDLLAEEDATRLSPRHRAAVELVDAMVWRPAALPTQVVAAVRAELSEAEAVEVVLDVLRNAGNKVAVALGADAARVTEGVELYTVDEHGNPVYDLVR